MRGKAWRSRLCVAAGALLVLCAGTAARAQDEQGMHFLRKGEIDGMSEAQFKAAMPELFPDVPLNKGQARPTDIPDIFGPGCVLSVGNVFMKVTNYGLFGNPFTNVSSDPSGQWPGASGVEYLNYVGFAVGAVNPIATDPNAVRRVSSVTEWRPATLDPVDKMYRSYDGILNGQRFYNDDGDLDLEGVPKIDEDFQDGHDNDLDGKIDEDFAAMGQQCFSCVIRDDTPQAINATAAEKHVPLGLECQQLAWAYSIPGFTDFNVVQWTIFNRSGHVLDSLVVGGLVDMDCGPITNSSYWTDDVDLAGYPSCILPHQTQGSDKRLQDSTMRIEHSPNVSMDSALCSHFPIRINGFSICDDDGDLGKTPGIPTFLLVDHTVDPTGVNGPSKVGFLAFRSFTWTTPYVGGGSPRTDQQRYEFMSGAAGTGVGEDGLINQPRSDERGDFGNWWSCGPWRNVPDGGSVQVTVAFTVARGDKALALKFPIDLLESKSNPGHEGELLTKYPSLDNAYAIQVAFEGIYEERADWPLLTNGHGRETYVRPGRADPMVSLTDCRSEAPINVDYMRPNWFDFDCDYCTGAFDARKTGANNQKGLGMFHRTWNADAPPPNPNLNVASSYNYTANPTRIVPAGDNQITLAWDNVSEITPDPKSGWLDLRGYRVWKAANWTRPVGSAGPSDDDWALVGEFRQFHYYNTTNQLIQRNYTYGFEDSLGTPGDSTKHCPVLWVPNRVFPRGSSRCPDGCVAGDSMQICLDVDDLWDRQSGTVLHPATDLPCVGDGAGHCVEVEGCKLGREPAHCGDVALDGSHPNKEFRTRFPVGRYRYVDREVKNGFVYFYSVTAFDSTGQGKSMLELSGRRSSSEGDGVVPQASTRAGKSVWVVPNPYRGYRQIQDRPSSWDLTPNGSDPTGTHVDFMGLPQGKWTIKIFTVSGDLVQVLHSEDPVNESIRSVVPGPNGTSLPGYNTQQDNPNDGQARWNLISRNGQDIVSGIYLFTVESNAGTQRGKFVVIR